VVPARVDPLILNLVRRAATREASRVHSQLSRGIFTLAIIARTAEWFGILRTCYGIVFSFPGFDGEPESIKACIEWLLSLSLYPTFWGIAVALLAHWIYKFLTSRLEQFDLEMHAAILDLTNSLSRLRFLTN
jgi:biopolymer transport protein ExbB/TolQ